MFMFYHSYIVLLVECLTFIALMYFSVENLIKVINYKVSKKIRNTSRARLEHFGRYKRPKETTVGRFVHKFRTTVSVGDTPKSGRPMIFGSSANTAILI